MTPEEQIKRSILDNGLAHAYLLEGEDAAAREACVMDLVRLILCREPSPERRPCGYCPSCRKIAGMSHEDVAVMEQTGKAQYRVQDAAAFMQKLSMSPYGERMVGVIPYAENLSETVQNKLLKTLEEPFPGTVIFLSAANREALLPTVRSRCILLRMEDAGSSPAAEAEAFGQITLFCDFRKELDQKIKAQEDAMAFLDRLEEEAGSVHDAAQVRQIEAARRDILRGMGYK
ncbi:MAG: hypothetical protein IJH77_03445 [Mogibacterium sp.]|nr:hypothetical protein [Mogibacterium sp.]